MDSLVRSDYLRRLGLTDWQPRDLPSVRGRAEETAAVSSALPHAPASQNADPLAHEPSPAAEPPVRRESENENAEPQARLPGLRSDSENTGQKLADSRGQSPSGLSEVPDSPAADALSAMGWEELEAWLARQDHRGATQPVFGVGARNAPLLVIGEAPGREEDHKGEPFVGRAGQLLDRMLAAIGHSRQENCYIANICKFRPPNNRDPIAAEIAADRPVLERQIALIAPRAILAVGRVAAQTLLHSEATLGQLRGRVRQYPGTTIPLHITYHPAYLLRSPNQKAKAWADLKALARALRETTS